MSEYLFQNGSEMLYVRADTGNSWGICFLSHRERQSEGKGKKKIKNTLFIENNKILSL